MTLKFSTLAVALGAGLCLAGGGAALAQTSMSANTMAPVPATMAPSTMSANTVAPHQAMKPVAAMAAPASGASMKPNSSDTMTAHPSNGM